jgi:hypothetical protein
LVWVFKINPFSELEKIGVASRFIIKYFGENLSDKLLKMNPPITAPNAQLNVVKAKVCPLLVW